MKKIVSTFLLALTLLPSLATAIGQTTRVNINNAGEEGNNNSFSHPSISANGRYVAFTSLADNLVVGDSNGYPDVFVQDRQSGKTERVSVNSAGEQGNLYSQLLDISANGRFVVFFSYANNLVTGDTNGSIDVFVHDRQTGKTERISVNNAGIQGNLDSGYALHSHQSISADGRYVVFQSSATNLVTGDTNGSADVFVHDRLTGKTELVSVNSIGKQGNFPSFDPSISADGRYVAFMSGADNLVEGDTNHFSDAFVHDRVSRKTKRVSIDNAGLESNDINVSTLISTDGNYVAFTSFASNLVADDTNGYGDVFVHNRQSGRTKRVSVDSAGQQGNSEVGYYLSFSADSRYVAFQSSASNLVSEDTNNATDIFIHDQHSGKTSRISVNSAGVQSNHINRAPSVSADGRFVVFNSGATNLVAGDSNDSEDTFVRDRLLLPKNQADISLALAGPTSAVKDSTANYTFTVTNNSSINVPNTNLTATISNRGILKSIVSSQGTCNRAAVIVCRLGTLAPGQNVQITASVTITGMTLISATAQSAPADNQLANNTKNITTALQ